LQRKTK